jgi:hypothetical protein
MANFFGIVHIPTLSRKNELQRNAASDKVAKEIRVTALSDLYPGAPFQIPAQPDPPTPHPPISRMPSPDGLITVEPEF